MSRTETSLKHGTEELRKDIHLYRVTVNYCEGTSLLLDDIHDTVVAAAQAGIDAMDKDALPRPVSFTVQDLSIEFKLTMTRVTGEKIVHGIGATYEAAESRARNLLWNSMYTGYEIEAVTPKLLAIRAERAAKAAKLEK